MKANKALTPFDPPPQQNRQQNQLNKSSKPQFTTWHQADQANCWRVSRNVNVHQK